MNGNDFYTILGLSGVVFGGFCLGYAVKSKRSIEKIVNKIDTCVEDISTNTDVVIPEFIIKRAVNDAVDREVSKEIKKAANKAVQEIESDISRKVSDAVNRSYHDINDSVKREVKEKVDEIDILDMKEEVIEEAKKEAIKKFDDGLDEILEKFNGDLKNVSRIYESISNSIASKSEGSTILKI